MSNMRKSKFLLSTAVLLAGVSLASAQGMREGGGGMNAGGAGAAERGSGGGMSQGRAGGGRAESPAAAPSGSARGEAMRESGRAAEKTARGERQTSKEQIGSDQRGQKQQTVGQGRDERDQTRQSKSESSKSETTKSESLKSESARSESDKRGKDQTVGESRRDRDQTGRSERAKSESAKQDKGATRDANTRENAQDKNAQQGRTTGANTREQSDNPARSESAQRDQGMTTGANAQGQANARTQAQDGMAQSMSGRVQVSEQQQTRLQQSVLSSRNVARVNAASINFRINTGVVVPRNISVVSVAAYPALIDIYPDYRDASFFVVDDEIVVLDERRRIVDVVPAGPRARYARGGSVGHGGGSVAALDLSPDEIRIVQGVLIERGLLSGEADGILGSDTRAALITFQRQEGFRTTGSIDSATVSALGVSSRITATRNESTTVGQGGGQRPSAPENTTDRAPTQQNEPATSGQAGTEQPKGQTTGQASAPRPSGQTTGQSPAQDAREPRANERSGQSDQNNAPASSPTQRPSNR